MSARALPPIAAGAHRRATAQGDRPFQPRSCRKRPRSCRGFFDGQTASIEAQQPLQRSGPRRQRSAPYPTPSACPNRDTLDRRPARYCAKRAPHQWRQRASSRLGRQAQRQSADRLHALPGRGRPAPRPYPEPPVANRATAATHRVSQRADQRQFLYADPAPVHRCRSPPTAVPALLVSVGDSPTGQSIRSDRCQQSRHRCGAAPIPADACPRQNPALFRRLLQSDAIGRPPHSLNSAAGRGGQRAAARSRARRTDSLP